MNKKKFMYIIDLIKITYIYTKIIKLYKFVLILKFIMKTLLKFKII